MKHPQDKLSSESSKSLTTLSGHGNKDALSVSTTSKISLDFLSRLFTFQSLTKSRASSLSRSLSHSPSFQTWLLMNPRSGTSTSRSEVHVATHSERLSPPSSRSASQKLPKTKLRSTSLQSSFKSSSSVLSSSAPRLPSPATAMKPPQSSLFSKSNQNLRILHKKSERNRLKPLFHVLRQFLHS